MLAVKSSLIYVVNRISSQMKETVPLKHPEFMLELSLSKHMYSFAKFGC